MCLQTVYACRISPFINTQANFDTNLAPRFPSSTSRHEIASLAFLYCSNVFCQSYDTIHTHVYQRRPDEKLLWYHLEESSAMTEYPILL